LLCDDGGGGDSVDLGDNNEPSGSRLACILRQPEVSMPKNPKKRKKS